ncbi:unnamed protein product [Ilex paraguariensis]|uniref:Uncharacterized protein n=1 Tax=Ilex paraguariensis TaxID=185542 RepID=A0ABC8TSB2_9AQUA
MASPFVIIWKKIRNKIDKSICCWKLSSGPKNITMDMILRSSSRFKKAKLTASQSQMEDTESQPVDVVPDSQGIIL